MRAIIEGSAFNVRGPQHVITEVTLERLSEDLDDKCERNDVPLNYGIRGWQKSVIENTAARTLSTMG
eukprot:4374001-Pyramimonas_sp.AAC.1